MMVGALKTSMDGDPGMRQMSVGALAERVIFWPVARSENVTLVLGDVIASLVC